MSSNPYARPPKPYNSYAAANSYYSSSAAATTSAAPYPAAASTSAYVAAAAGPVLPAGYAAYPSAVAAAGPVYPGMTAGAGPSDLDAQQASIYTPEAARANKPVTGANGGGSGSKAKGRTTVLRKGGGELWEDQTLLEWDPSHFRLFIGDLDPAISDDAFRSAFSGPRFPSFVKSKVVRDKYTNKGKGFGFVAYSDPEDFLKAWKEMNGKYVGTRPVTIKKATAGVKAVEIGDRKARMLEAKRPQKTGTVPYERANAEDAGHRAIPGEKGYGPQRTRKQYIRR
ncbi:hypothetical protein B0A53_01011 [Rhodotorula sp. CCFEE 5036]|nr:hypothetical protein B0A53_01011 [Rhodotorula sp. CCFEE 5036]